MFNLYLLISVLIFGLVTGDHKCWKNQNNCVGCLEANGCGFCGVFASEGFCVPIDLEMENDWCPDQYWKTSSGDPLAECAAPLRQTVVNATDERVQYISLGIGGQSSAEAVVDVLLFEANVVPDVDDDDDRAFRIAIGYGVGDLTTVQYDFFGVGYGALVEYDDPEDNGFNCTSTASPTDCPDFARIRSIYDLAGNASVNTARIPIDVDFIPTSVVNQTIFQVNMSDTSGYFNLSCRTSNGMFQYEGLSLDPYSFKCDVMIQNYPYTSSNSSLALATWMAAASVNDSLADESQPMGDVVMGSGLAHLFWSRTADTDSGGPSTPVVHNDIALVNETLDLDPSAEVVITFFSFLTKAPASVFWDPLLQVDPVGRSVVPSTASSLQSWLSGLLAYCLA